MNHRGMVFNTKKIAKHCSEILLYINIFRQDG